MSSVRMCVVAVACAAMMACAATPASVTVSPERRVATYGYLMLAPMESMRQSLNISKATGLPVDQWRKGMEALDRLGARHEQLIDALEAYERAQAALDVTGTATLRQTITSLLLALASESHGVTDAVLDPKTKTELAMASQQIIRLALTLNVAMGGVPPAMQELEV